MIEAMACGTPVIAFRCGSVPEVIDDGVAGLRRRQRRRGGRRRAATSTGSTAPRCARTFERRFTAERMARDYLAIYQRAVPAQRGRRDAALGRGRSPELTALRPEAGDAKPARASTRPRRPRQPSAEPLAQFVIPAATSLQERRPRALKHGDTFAVFDRYGDAAGRRPAARRASTTATPATCRTSS